MKKLNLSICCVLLSILCSAQTVEMVFHPTQKEWFQKRNFPIAHYDFKDETINKYLRKSRRLKNTNTAVIVGGIPLFFLFWPSVAATIPASLQVRSAAMNHLNVATSRWLINQYGGKVYQGSEDFRKPNHLKWYRKENVLVDYYDGKIIYVNNVLTKAYDLRQKSNLLYWTGAVSGVVGPILLIAGVLQAFSDENDGNPFFIIAGTGLTLTSPISLISALVVKGRSRRMLTEASSRWYSELSN